MFSTLVTTPLYNGIVFLMDVLPWADLGIIVILFTIIVRLVLFPLAHKAIKTQVVMKELQPELEEIKKQNKDNSQEQAMKTMALYRERGINPFSSFFFLLIQLPIIFGLYFVFLRGGFPEIDIARLYSFVMAPESINPLFLGLVDMTQKSFIVALLAGVTQFFQAKLMSPALPKKGDKPSFGTDFARSLQLQMKYVFPVIVVFISLALPSSIALYWSTSNVFSIAQELFVRKQIREKQE